VARNPTIPFDFAYTKAVPESKDAKEVDSMISLVMVDSSTGYVHAAPLRSKNQRDLMVRELLGFAGLVGHAELVFMCDNEPTLRQLQRMAVNARLSLGLATRATTPPPYSHGNSLVENAIGRIRPLAGMLMHYLSEQVGVEFSSNSPWWSWVFRHACWLMTMNRFNANKGVTAYELCTTKSMPGPSAILENLFLVLARFLERGQPSGLEWFSWERAIPRIHTSCTMVQVW